MKNSQISVKCSKYVIRCDGYADTMLCKCSCEMNLIFDAHKKCEGLFDNTYNTYIMIGDQL